MKRALLKGVGLPQMSTMFPTYESLDVWQNLRKNRDSVCDPGTTQIERARACLEADRSLVGCIYFEDLPRMQLRRRRVCKIAVPPVDMLDGMFFSHPVSQAWLEVRAGAGIIRVDIGASGGLLPKGVSCLRAPCVLCVRPDGPDYVIPTATMRAVVLHKQINN